jgi:hypothetical protein
MVPSLTKQEEEEQQKKNNFHPAVVEQSCISLGPSTSDGTNSYGLKNLGTKLITYLFNSPPTKPSEASSTGSPKNLLTPKTHAQQQELASKRCILSTTNLSPPKFIRS